MAKLHSHSFLHTLWILVATITLHCDAGTGDRKVYIVYMGGLPAESEYFPSFHHQSILEEVVEGSLVKDSLVHSYKRSFNGFAAKLTEIEAQKLSGMEGIVSVFPSGTLQLHTTRSWDFMGFPETVKRVPTVESDVIIGVIDDGIWPELPSFSDDGFGPPPKKWKGVCEGGKNFTCNNKVIGARFYGSLGFKVVDSARDLSGHGSHTASTAAGNTVKDVSFYELARGNARGAVPSARIAVYKACNYGCGEADILAAFDDAIADGVDILSVSLGSLKPHDFDKDSVAIGSFHAMQNGILTSNSAGNSGPTPETVSSIAPWLLTVAASSTDRRMIDKVVLGNGVTVVGKSINSFKSNGPKFPVVYGKNVTSNCTLDDARRCSHGCVDSSLVKGKIVVCDSVTRGEIARDAGALGAIMVYDGYSDFSFVYPFPATILSNKDGNMLKSYIQTNKNAKANILKAECVKDFEAPVVVSFSSRGPNTRVPDIIKPDISAPGVDILAAYSPVSSPSEVSTDHRSVKYSILSGTSMSCPHATGAAAYVKSFHPDWSPSAIKSALMTTATTMNATKNPEGEFAYGSGHIDPVKAVNPGLVYDASKEDYLKLLCDLGFNSTRFKLITNSSCPKGPKRAARDLNYPSLGALVEEGKPINLNFTRMVTNVGSANSRYKAIITSDDRIKVTVAPDVLSFESLNEKKSVVVNVVGEGLQSNNTATGSLVWSDGVHTVRSPIVIYVRSTLPKLAN